jgi:ATP-binding cassette, subfamily D (ALD), peroxisomal long-chain fatty acid import protein
MLPAGLIASPVYSVYPLIPSIYSPHPEPSSGNILKPLLDIILFTSQLSRSLGVKGTAALFLNYYVTARILRAVTPAFGRLAAVEAHLEGEYRAGVARVGRDAEEVA